MYADDTVLYMSELCPNTARDKNEAIMVKLYNWCIKNKLTTNLKKTKHMMILRKNNPQQSQNNTRIKIGNDHIENVSMYHYLGVDLDRGLTFDKMLDNMFNKANRKLYMLIGPYITNTVSNHTYKTRVLPMLDYADFLVDSGRLEKIERLDTLQKRVVKVIDKKLNRGLSTDGLMMGLYGLQTLRKRGETHHQVLMYRLKSDPYYVETYKPDIGLRSNTKIKFRTRTTRLRLVLNSPYYRGICLWNRLPENVQKATTKVKFKQQISLKMDLLPIDDSH